MKKIFSILLSSFLILNLFPYTLKADMGPKPSVTVTVEGLDSNKTYYMSLLTDDDSYGPWNRLTEDMIDQNNPAEVAFLNYKDSDGYASLDYYQKIGGNKCSWSYYPPYKFKIAIYCVEDDSMLVSDIFSRTAFESCFLANYGPTLTVEEQDNSGTVMLHGILRALVTIVVELGLALLFKYREKKQIVIIIITNLITQLLLNLFLASTIYYGGALVWMIMFVIGELLVLIIEEIVYMISFRKMGKGKAFLYALLANVISGALTFFSTLYTLI